MSIRVEEHKLFVNDQEIYLGSRKVRRTLNSKGLIVVIFEIDDTLNKKLNNVIALRRADLSVIWEIEKDDSIDFENPYLGGVLSDSFLILDKSNYTRVAVNLHNGKIIRNIDLMTGHRPW